jgi:hypothetical protein
MPELLNMCTFPNFLGYAVTNIYTASQKCHACFQVLVCKAYSSWTILRYFIWKHVIYPWHLQYNHKVEELLNTRWCLTSLSDVVRKICYWMYRNRLRESWVWFLTAPRCVFLCIDEDMAFAEARFLNVENTRLHRCLKPMLSYITFPLLAILLMGVTACTSGK